MRTNLIKSKLPPEEGIIKASNKPQSKEKVSSTPEDSILDMIIAFDTTGSMDSYIDIVRDYIVGLVDTLIDTNPNLRLGIVAFGDYHDMVNKYEFGRAYQVLQPTDNKELLIDFIKDAKNTSGGDSNEFYELVIHKIVNETMWRYGSNKAVLLIADDEPHNTNYKHRNLTTNYNWKEEAYKAAEKGIKFDTVTIKEYKWFKELSRITNGISVPFKTSNVVKQLITASVLSRGGEESKAMFKRMANEAVISGSEESRVIYDSYSKEIVD